MADFGIGVAGGVLIEVVKAIIDIAEEVRLNKKQAKILAAQCHTISDEITNILRSNANALSADTATYSKVTSYVQTFKALMQSIEAEMQKWADNKLWTRVLYKGDMAEAIQDLNRRLTDEWHKFDSFLSLQNIATAAVTLAALQRSITDFEDARKDDAAINALILEELKQTVELAKSSNEKLDHHGKMIVQVLDAVHQLAPAATTEPEDEETRANQKRIQEALRDYDGDLPSLGIDSSELTITLATPFYRGKHAEIFKGFRSGKTVAVKKLNLTDADEIERVYGRIMNESEIWRLLRHENIVRFLGCCRPNNQIAFMVSEWATNRDARRYLQANPSAPRLKIVSLFRADWMGYVLTYNTYSCTSHCSYQVLTNLTFTDSVGVSRGLDFLHTFVKPRKTEITPIVHASLKGGHVLLDDKLTPRLSDFGIAFIANEVYPGSRPPETRWSAPELLENDIANIKSDIYSLGMVILELITIKNPFDDKRLPGNKLTNKLRTMIIRGTRPLFPTGDLSAHGLPNDQCPLWQLMQRCWKADPSERPDSTEVMEALQTLFEANPDS